MPIIKFFGQFHPLIVHLPIGIFVLAMLIYLLPTNERLYQKKYVLSLVLLVTAISATLSSITGLIIADSNSYGSELVGQHQWLALGFTISSWLTYLLLKFKSTQIKWLLNGLISVSSLLIILTGHAGGTLTHGSDFLTPPPFAQWFDSKPEPSLSLNENSLVYEAVEGVFSKKCYSCHGPNRQKGKLRLDSPEFILLGGKNGSVLSGTAASGNGLLERIHLPIGDEDRMPPKEKTQLTESEIELLTWWLKNGHSFDVRISEAGWSESLKTEFVLNELDDDRQQSNSIIPEQTVEPAKKELLDSLHSLKAVLAPYAQNSNYLSASLYNVSSENLLSVIRILSNLSPQLLSLKISAMKLKDTHTTLIARIISLKRLQITHCSLSDQDMKALATLPNLEQINIVGNDITASGLLSLTKLTKLKTVYIWQTKISASDVEALQKDFNGVHFEIGNYVVPTFQSDTTKLSAS